MDFKGVNGPIVVSENVLYNYFDTSTSNGDIIRINDEWLPREVWIINNYFYNGVMGVNPARSDVDELYVLGNSNS